MELIDIIDKNSFCAICEHKHKVNMESALLAGQNVNKVAEFYDVSPDALERHKNICSTHLLTLDEFDAMVVEEVYALDNSQMSKNAGVKKPGSLQIQLGLREADNLAAALQDYLVTLKNLSQRINMFISESDTPEGLSKQRQFLRLPVLQTYVQIGGEMRQIVREMANIHKMINGAEPENVASGLAVLANAITASKEATK